jgi:regulator of sigma E protease
MLVLEIIGGLLILVFLVVVHELGHAIAARRNGVVVEEFGIGFPPRAWGKKLKNGVLLSLNWLPIGGFVKLQGEHDAASTSGDYGAASFWQKTKILLAGVFINWIVAALLLTILAWAGLPKIIPNQFSVAGDTVSVKQPVELVSIVKGSPAERAGLQPGDRIIRFAGEPVTMLDSLGQQSAAHKGQTVEIIYDRHNVEHSTQAMLRTSGNEGYLGVTSAQRQYMRSSWSAPLVGVVLTGQLTGATFQGLGDLVSNLAQGIVLQFSPDHATKQKAQTALTTAGNSVAGPVGILGTIFPAAEQAGLGSVVLLTAVISLTLAVMNVLPIPALDGGRWYTMAIFRILKKPLTKEREEAIQATGFTVLMALIVIVTVLDVSKLFK